MIATVLHLQQWLGPHVLQVEYIWMTRLLPLVRADVLKVIDTHDVFSSIEQKVRMFGVRDVIVDPREEAERLRRADLIIAIQDEERQELQRLAPGIPVVTAGVDFDVVADAAGSIAGRILFVASGNPRNCKGLTDFVRLAWPRIRRRVPDAELVVVGGVAAAVAGRPVPGRHGRRRGRRRGAAVPRSGAGHQSGRRRDRARRSRPSKRSVICGRSSPGRPASTGSIRGWRRDASSPATGTSSPTRSSTR